MQPGFSNPWLWLPNSLLHFFKIFVPSIIKHQNVKTSFSSFSAFNNKNVTSPLPILIPHLHDHPLSRTLLSGIQILSNPIIHPCQSPSWKQGDVSARYTTAYHMHERHYWRVAGATCMVQNVGAIGRQDSLKQFEVNAMEAGGAGTCLHREMHSSFHTCRTYLLFIGRVCESCTSMRFGMR